MKPTQRTGIIWKTFTELTMSTCVRTLIGNHEVTKPHVPSEKCPHEI